MKRVATIVCVLSVILCIMVICVKAEAHTPKMEREFVVDEWIVNKDGSLSHYKATDTIENGGRISVSFAEDTIYS